jgi:hypothetical protein
MAESQRDYKRSFGLGMPGGLHKVEKALDLALDIRKFEISLYWQRTAYFWALIAAAFAGYFAILGTEHLTDKEYLAFVISCVGLVFSFAWYLVNRGSKYWQENWENHVDMLEDDIVGPLYKTILHRPSHRRWHEYVTGPLSISVSKVNLIVSLFTIFIWLGLLKHSLPAFHRAASVSWKHVEVGIPTALFILWMLFGARTHMGSHEHVMARRKTEIVD